ncbi:MAG: hypothetical protein NVSMB51_01970 [Solirubrobacteraceae bacterium]
MIIWRVVPWEPRARANARGGALWIPRELQGRGRHDNPELYGCLYASETAPGAIAEALSAYRGSGPLTPALLRRGGHALGLARLRILPAEGGLLELDEPRVLVRERLRPSQVATRRRAVTQAWAARLWGEHRAAPGLRWWSTLEAEWGNVTLWDRALARLRCEAVEPLAIGMAPLREAADLLGL